MTATNVGYGGHRDPIPDQNARIDEIIEHHLSWKEYIAELIAESKPIMAYLIMKKMFPDLPATEMFTGMSEVIGHLNLLKEEQRVGTTKINGVVHYRSVA